MDLTRLMVHRIEGEHPHAATKAHADVEELHVKLAVGNVIPQRMLRVILNAVVRLRRERCQRLRQRFGCTAPRTLRDIVRHGLQHGKIEAAALTVGDIGICRKSLARKERSESGCPARSGQYHRRF